MPGRSLFRGLIHRKIGFTLLRFSSLRLAQQPCSGDSGLPSGKDGAFRAVKAKTV